jgi:integrase
VPKITKTLIDNAAAAAATDVWINDTELPGFSVRIQPSGRKTYVVRYRSRITKTQRKMTIARCTDMPPDRARDLARKAFMAVAEGRDPVADERREAADARTVDEMKTRYMKEHAAPFKKPASADLDEKNWRLHILPRLGKKLVRQVTKAEILTLFGSMSETPATANQCLALLSKAFNLAEDWEWRDRNTNPCHKIKKYEVQERELILTIDQINGLNSTLTVMVRDDTITQSFADLIRLLLLTGCRLREIMHAKRAWIDQDRSLLLLPDSKVGQRKIALSAQALAIAVSVPQVEEWLIAGRVKGQPLITPYKVWTKVKKAARLPKELRLHDLRHSAGSLGHMAGLSQKDIQIMLGHKQMSTTERYLHGHVGANAAIADKMSATIASAWAPQEAVAA